MTIQHSEYKVSTSKATRLSIRLYRTLSFYQTLLDWAPDLLGALLGLPNESSFLSPCRASNIQVQILDSKKEGTFYALCTERLLPIV